MEEIQQRTVQVVREHLSAPSYPPVSEVGKSEPDWGTLRTPRSPPAKRLDGALSGVVIGNSHLFPLGTQALRDKREPQKHPLWP